MGYVDCSSSLLFKHMSTFKLCSCFLLGKQKHPCLINFASHEESIFSVPSPTGISCNMAENCNILIKISKINLNYIDLYSDTSQIPPCILKH